ncbi:MAG: hypothetical protein GC154_08845 [bacterium]|nr:hypothetical protein [bacterium]
MQKSLQHQLCTRAERSHCVLLPSATVGLALALRAWGVENKPVAVPASVCLNVPIAVLLAGGRPVYCDVEPDTLGLSVDTLREGCEAPAAVIAVHAYGAPCEIGPIHQYCRGKAIPLIEDVAAAQGVQYHDKLGGSFGDVGIFSFGGGKIINQSGGGALVTDDAELAEAIQCWVRELPDRSPIQDEALHEFDRYHTKLYNKSYGKDLKLYVADFVRKLHVIMPYYMTKPVWPVDSVLECLNNLPDLIENRWKNYQLFLDHFRETESCQVFRFPEGSVPWRLNLFFKNRRDDVLRELLTRGIKVSSWFPPACEFLDDSFHPERIPVSCDIGASILNIWINEEIDGEYIQTTARLIQEML